MVAMELCPGGTESNFSTVASENSEVISARSVEMGVSSLSAELVANECLDAFLKDRMYVITGRSSKIMRAIGRLTYCPCGCHPIYLEKSNRV